MVTALILGLAAALMVGAHHPPPSIAEAAAAPGALVAQRAATPDMMSTSARTAERPIVATQVDDGPGDLPHRRWMPAAPAVASVASVAAAPAAVEASVADAAVPLPPVAAVSLVALPLLFADVWNAEERYFAISGATPDQLIASAKASIPADPHGAMHNAVAYSGPVVWDHVPTYVIDPASGACTMTGVNTTASYQATLPQWTSPAHVPPELLVWWQIVLEEIRHHEGHHISIFSDFVTALPGRVSGQSCDAWVSIATQWSADVTAAHAAFDAQEAAWVFPAYAGPP